jgi:UDP-N-acetylglucosamine 2-epimerase (non-hydrolysing)
MIMGTRPEAIKMAPIVRLFHETPDIDPVVCFTGQHRELLEQVAIYFDLKADIDLNLMKPNQTLNGLMARCIEGLDHAIEKYHPESVIAQGDTTTVAASAIVAFQKQLPFIHVEAGLRTGNLQSPWPEEFNRRISSIATTIHCAPTSLAAQNLLREGYPESTVSVTGNTVIDALLYTQSKEKSRSEKWYQKYPYLRDRRMVLITGHRRENHGATLRGLCNAIRELAETFPDTAFVYPVHPNPHVRETTAQLLSSTQNIHLTEPAAYPEFVWLMDQSYIIITDSGGVQEEAPTLGKPVLVTRDTTERPEAVTAGAAKLIGTSPQILLKEAKLLLSSENEYRNRQVQANPYGDGQASTRILDLIRNLERKRIAA